MGQRDGDQRRWRQRLGRERRPHLCEFQRRGAFLIERLGNGLAARWLYPAYFVCAEGMLAGGADAELALFEAFERGGFEFVQSLRWNERTDPARRWYGTASWSLAYDGVD